MEDAPLFSKILLDKLLKDARMSPGTSPAVAFFVSVGRGVVVIGLIIVIELRTIQHVSSLTTQHSLKTKNILVSRGKTRV